ncbi:MAG: LPS assembly lipoprotein LptE [Betaproteobacteria bacterium]|nr:LPS assembly lipoprotein LptE [Betaproteobacteria bacterium]
MKLPHKTLSSVLVLLVLLLGGCGFQLRGTATLPFDTLFVQAAPTSQFANQFKRAVTFGSTTRLVGAQKDAAATLVLVTELREKNILSLSGTGRVREYQLRYRVAYRLIDRKGVEVAPAAEIVLNRDFSFNDNETLSKESEEALLFRDMQADAVQQLLRRLQAARLNPAA